MLKNFYLRSSVVIEPLINHWYAWPNLISPATGAMYVANLHVKMMQSFVASPRSHEAALRQPEMMGGPFIDLPSTRVAEVKDLLTRTLQQQEPLIRMAAAIAALDALLSAEARGNPLEPLYARVPEPLRGFVELVYDLSHQPSFRLLEGLLYRSPYYQRESQSVSLSLHDRDDRTFVLSTPRLFMDSALHLRKSFNHPGLEAMLRMRHQGLPLGELIERLGEPELSEQQLAPWFTEQPPPAPKRFDGEGVRIRYFGHACVLIETRDVVIMTDPLIPYPCGDDPDAVSRFSYADLPAVIDYVLITHSHQDHCLLEHLLQLKSRIKTIVVPRNASGSLLDPSLKLMLRVLGFANVITLDDTESIEVEGGRIIGLPFLGEHGDLSVLTKMAYLIELGGQSILFAADSRNLDPRLYDHIHAFVGEIDLLFVGMECAGAPMSWLYGPLFTRPVLRKFDHTRRLNGSNCEGVLGILDRLRPKQVYVYAMGAEPWVTFVSSVRYTEESLPIVESNALIKQCLARGLVAERLFGAKMIHLASGRADAG